MRLAILLVTLTAVLRAGAREFAETPWIPVARTAQGDRVLVEGHGTAHPLAGAALRALPQDTTSARTHDRPMQTLIGPSRAAVLGAQGARLDSLQGRALAQYVLVEARDDSRVVFAAAALHHGLTGRRVILAHLADGRALDSVMGPWRVIAERDSRPARWIRQVSALRLRAGQPWAASCRGRRCLRCDPTASAP